VEPDDLVTMAEIARRAGRSRESVRQLVTGERGPGGFPPPVANLTRRSPGWRWGDVVGWLAGKGAVDKRRPPGAARARSGAEDLGTAVAAINAVLELRRHVRTEAEAEELFRRLLAPRRTGGKARTARRPV